MANAKTKEKRRLARQRQNANALTKAQEDQNEDLGGEETDSSLENLPQTEQIEKHYDEVGQSVVLPGPVSWDEYDQEKVARERASQVREVTWTVQDLVSNILYSADMKGNEKADAIKKVGDGFGKRLKEVEKVVKEISIDMDLLELQAVIGSDSRNTSVVEKVGDWIAKKRYKRTENSSSSYLLHDKAHVRQSLKLVAELIGKGGDEAEAARVSLPEIKQAAKDFGIGIKGSVHIQKDKSGQWRAILWPSNNFIDDDQDILSEQAHIEYVEWVNENMDVAPVFMTKHIAGTLRKNKIDFVGYESGFLIMSAPLEEHEAAGLFRTQALVDIGLSHGSLGWRNNGDDRIVEKYRMVEVSDLPLDTAANPFTDLETLQKEASMDTKQYLTSILGSEEEAQKYLTKMENKQAALRAKGIEEKEKSEPTPPAPGTTVVVTTPAAPIAAAPVPDMALIVETVKKELGVDGLDEFLTNLQAAAEKVPVLEQLVKELAGSQDERLADKINPPALKMHVWQKARASQKDETILDEGTEADANLKKAKPELGWLSEATRTTPVEAQ